MTERELLFRNDPPSRAWLEGVLKHPIFKEAVEILRERRNVYEAKVELAGLSNDGMPSTRMNSQRIGMEGVFIDLPVLTTPPEVENAEPEADYQQPEAYSKLNQ